jgi:hypothetical protein
MPITNPKGDREGKPTPDREGEPQQYTTFGIALYLLVIVGLDNFVSTMEFSPAIISSMVIRSEVSLLDNNPKHAIVNELLQAYFD